MVWSQRVLIKIYERASRISSYTPSILTSLPNTILPLFFIPLLSLSFQRRSSRQPPRRESGEPFFRSPFSNATVRVFGEFGMSWHHVNSRGTELDRAYILRISEAAVSIALNPRFPPKTYVPRNVYLERRSSAFIVLTR